MDIADFSNDLVFLKQLNLDYVPAMRIENDTLIPIALSFFIPEPFQSRIYSIFSSINYSIK